MKQLPNRFASLLRNLLCVVPPTPLSGVASNLAAVSRTPFIPGNLAANRLRDEKGSFISNDKKTKEISELTE
jgi:hypothetical protein